MADRLETKPEHFRTCLPDVPARPAAAHDLPLVKGSEYPRLTRIAVDNVAAAAGLTPAHSAAHSGPLSLGCGSATV